MSATGSQVNAFDALKVEDLGTCTLGALVAALLESGDNYSADFRAWLERRRDR